MNPAEATAFAMGALFASCLSMLSMAWASMRIRQILEKK